MSYNLFCTDQPFVAQAEYLTSAFPSATNSADSEGEDGNGILQR